MSAFATVSDDWPLPISAHAPDQTDRAPIRPPWVAARPAVRASCRQTAGAHRRRPSSRTRTRRRWPSVGLDVGQMAENKEAEKAGR